MQIALVQSNITACEEECAVVRPRIAEQADRWVEPPPQRVDPRRQD